MLNRGNGRQRLFHKDRDYLAFGRVLAEGLERYRVDLLAWCLMPNHWHLVLRPRDAEALSQLMGWIGVTHVRRHHQHYHTRGGGHLYQGRFKSFPVQDDVHFRTVCRYVEANARRAKLVRRAEQWPWSSLAQAPAPTAESRPWPTLAAWPMPRPSDWLERGKKRGHYSLYPIFSGDHFSFPDKYNVDPLQSSNWQTDMNSEAQ